MYLFSNFYHCNFPLRLKIDIFQEYAYTYNSEIRIQVNRSCDGNHTKIYAPSKTWNWPVCAPFQFALVDSIIGWFFETWQEEASLMRTQGLWKKALVIFFLQTKNGAKLQNNNYCLLILSVNRAKHEVLEQMKCSCKFSKMKINKNRLSLAGLSWT